MVTIPWQPALSVQQLQALSDPISAGQPEVVPWQLYDTAAFANAAAGPFVYFQAINADKTLSNMEGPGQLPDPQYLIIQYVACDILIPAVNTVLANEPQQGWADATNILATNRATFLMGMSNKNYGPFSLTMCHATGGATGSGYGYGTAANGTATSIVNNGNPGSGGFPFCGAVILPPKIGFNVTVAVAAAITMAATRQVRISLVGQLYRRVL